MTKQDRYRLYKHAVGPGWWSLLDRYVNKILECDPDAEFMVKEKFGGLRLRFRSENFTALEYLEMKIAAEEESFAVCEYCGAPGEIRYDRDWITALCDRCNGLDQAAKGKICEETERNWQEKM